jgi:phage-related protein
MTALPLTQFIIQSAQKSVNYATLVAQFGDGYMQRAGDGINKKQEMWSITYDNMNQTERDILWIFIESVQMSDVIEWTAPGDLAEKKWIIDPETKITEQAKAGAIYTVGFTLQRVFDL